ncbi:high mobility group B protein 6-like isoform X1 [Zingiber officinale]|uniref:high mobility group B protein 6-like isoform X1 n=1 Tax=Zingiber officinale TaxID=94328 RepID=UPI001C4B3A21|nr:high mobility group B protein 6-like isoform X1 [Zingiber officinale]XP_042409156.1 high mobility group B protein 6-like isoform X1 [Zingiber officinale]XP_042435360.1 high mobility group B protein 6-like isoform X1 [Zingiber officinale]XP_042435361.1 high mobility group B protein 6-like isoform X1 [Zingiber officinale]XP_042447601.1 high mobility group B protein 6-like isoform X1 [Zingiber officinale]XP_042447602.1 high mobility group B protein 6-like isoform X1 [Zingiber officinale]
MPLSGLDGRWWPWRRKKKEAYQEVVKQENREKEAMKLLEKEHLQKTAMELLEQYLQFQQEREGCFEAKHPMSAFFLFSKERREALLQEKKTILEISKIAGEEWKNMAEEQKAPYEEEQNGIFSCASSI